MRKTAVWKADAATGKFPALSENITADVAIIGGGITGITAAMLLAREGKRVVVLEAIHVGGGTTGFSTGNLYSEIDEQLHKIRSKFDADTMKQVVAARTAAINRIEKFVNEYSIDCNFHRVPWYLLAEDESDNDTIDKEFEAAIEAGLPAVKMEESPLPFKITKALRIDNQAQFNPLRYIEMLSHHIDESFCRIYTETKVTRIEEGAPNILHTAGGTVTAKYVIHATHSPKGVMAVQTLLGPYREYALAVKLRSNYYPPGTFWTFNKPHHHSMRTYQASDGQQFLLILGEPHKVGQKEDNDECFRRLEEYIRARFDVESIEYAWGAQHYKAADGLPYIGKHDEEHDIYIATGFSTDGLVYGTLAAMIITDQIAGRENLWSKVFDPSRHNPFKSATKFIKENLNVLAQYVKDLPFVGDVEKFTDVNPGEGKVVEIDGEKFAAYRDDQKQLHIVSAVCTHMKCIVQWNRAETSWDCPCHGSRFTIDGKVIEGPAIDDLGKLKEKETKNA